MERKTRLWLGLGAAVMFTGGTPTHAAVDDGAAATRADGAELRGTETALDRPFDAIRIAQAEGGEGEGAEGGGQVLGTITEFRLATTDPDAYNYDAVGQVETYAALVYQAYEALYAAALEMQAAIEALIAEPSPETLDAARSAWIAARAAYSRTEAFLFYAGPIDGETGPLLRLAAWPINPSLIDYVEGNPEAGLVNDPDIALTRRGLAAMNQATGESDVTLGWHVIEFLLWGEDRGADNLRPHTDYVAGEGVNDRRSEYLQVVTQALLTDIANLVSAWAPDANNYRRTLEVMDQRNAIGRAFNGMAVLAGYELPLRRIGASLRRDDEDFEQSQFSDNTTADLVNALAGIRNVYFGETGDAGAIGFDALLAEVDSELNDRVVTAFASAEAAVAALDVPFDSILASPADSPARAEAEAAAQALRDLGEALRQAGNRLGVLVLVPGL